MSTTQISVKRDQDKWDELRAQIRGTYWTERLWHEKLSSTDQRRLGGNLKPVLPKLGGTWDMG